VVDNLRSAVRFFSKILRAEFGSTVIIILTLALAISANTVCFGLLNALLFKPQPGIGHPEELVDLGRTLKGSGFDQLSFPNILDYQKDNYVFAGLAVYTETPRSMSLRVSNQAERVWGIPVTGNLFDVLHARPAAGRFFSPDDEQPGRELVTVISYGFWQRRFNGDPSIIGRQFTLNARRVTIIGVAPQGFDGVNYARADLWTPLVTEIFHRQEAHFDRGSTFGYAIARLKPGVSIEKAQADIDVISARLEQAFPEDNRGYAVRLVRHNPFSALENNFYAFIAMLFAIALLVLLIACINVAGVCLARNAARTREIAIRLAMGASRLRVMSQLMMETAVLFAVAGLLAGLGALWLTDLVSKLQSLLPVPIVIDLAPDIRIAIFVVSLVVLAGAGAGLLPAFQAARTAPAAAMKEESIGWTSSRVRLRNTFVVTQIAVSLLLLVIGGLFVRSLSFAGRVDPGFQPKNLEALALNWFIAGYGEDDLPGRQSLEAFEKALLQRTLALPNVEAASIATDIPMDGTGAGFNIVTIPGLQASDRRRGVRNADWNLVSPGYFNTMKIPLLRGRDFTEAERSGFAIINETMARRYWPGQDPIGQSLYDGEVKDGRLMEVIGIVKDTNTRYVGQPAEPMLYAPLGQYSFPQHYLMVRTTGESAAPQLRQLLLEINPNLPVLSVQSMDELISIGLLPQRIGAWAGTGMGFVGLLLASLGIYGVTAFSVTRRTREIGVRTALGATPALILRIVFRDGLMLAFVGIVIGLAAGLATTRFIGGFLFGIGPADAVSFATMAGLLAAVTLLATYVPARRATKIDPMAALRHQ